MQKLNAILDCNMMDFLNTDYQIEQTEQIAVDALVRCGVDCFRNNIEDKLAVDICTKQGIRIDVQFSNNFAKYGDFKLDIISIFKPKNIEPNVEYEYNPNTNIIRNFEKKHNCVVHKLGKAIQPNYLDYLFVLFYNEEYTTANPKPDFLLLISRQDLINFCKPRVERLLPRLIISNKQQEVNNVGLDDEYGSAFLPLNVKDLMIYTNCIFGSYDDLVKSDNMKIQSYIK